jgi:hypothetical protein
MLLLKLRYAKYLLYRHNAIFWKIFGPTSEKFSHDKKECMIVQQDGATNRTCGHKFNGRFADYLLVMNNYLRFSFLSCPFTWYYLMWPVPGGLFERKLIWIHSTHRGETSRNHYTCRKEISKQEFQLSINILATRKYLYLERFLTALPTTGSTSGGAVRCCFSPNIKNIPLWAWSDRGARGKSPCVICCKCSIQCTLFLYTTWANFRLCERLCCKLYPLRYICCCLAHKCTLSCE